QRRLRWRPAPRANKPEAEAYDNKEPQTAECQRGRRHRRGGLVREGAAIGLLHRETKHTSGRRGLSNCFFALRQDRCTISRSPAAATPAPDAKTTAQATPPVGDVAPAPSVTPEAKPEASVAATVATPAAATPPVQVNAFASSSYSYNFNKPSDRKNGIRVFD